MRIQNNVSLKRFNTYKVDVKAKYFVRIKDVEEIKALIKKYEYKSSKDVMVLGGGSNTLFTKNFDGMIIKNEILGRKIFKEDAKSMLIEFGAGEIWDDVVKYCVNKNLGGIENMAYIPGTIGGAATGNIAAYDQNLETVFHSLLAINKKTGVLKKFLKKDCGFGYRDSLFKKENNVWIITNVILKLNKNPILDVNYYEKGLSKTSIHTELELIVKDIQIKKIKVSVDGKKPYTLIVGKDGWWDYTMTSPKKNHEYKFDIYSQNRDGDKSDNSNFYVMVL